MGILLNALYLLLLVIVSPWFVWRSWNHGRYRRGWTDKLLGLCQPPPTSQSLVWLHAVSVGEVQVLRTLVETLESERPDLCLAISVSTDSGMDLATKLFPNHYLFFAPFDFTWSIKKTLRVLRPKLIVLAELELWPNWLLQAEKIACPVAVINGRLSQRSFSGYARIPYLVHKCMRTIDWVGAQSQSVATRFEQLGVLPTSITVTGNVKFDGATGNRFASEVTSRKKFLSLTEPTALAAVCDSRDSEPTALAAVCDSVSRDSNPTALAAVCDSADPAKTPLNPAASARGSNNQVVFLAGSTQSPEESIVLTAFLQLSDRFPNLKLILVPRHAERFEEVAKMIAAIGLPWVRRSECQTAVIDPNWRIFLADSVGELRWWWGLADVGFVGGSFGDRGGQNMIEPCAYGVATCFGPNTRNFSDIVKLLLDENACEQLHAPDELRPWLESILTNATKRNAMSTQAIQACQTHRGASQRTWENIQRLLDNSTQVFADVIP